MLSYPCESLLVLNVVELNLFLFQWFAISVSKPSLDDVVVLVGTYVPKNVFSNYSIFKCIYVRTLTVRSGILLSISVNVLTIFRFGV